MPTLSEEFDDIVAFVENSGRLDQIMANIETLFLKLDCGKRLYLMSSNSLSFLVPPGLNLIKVIVPCSCIFHYINNTFIIAFHTS